jgi:uncharacterized lipoprotein YajG
MAKTTKKEDALSTTSDVVSEGASPSPAAIETAVSNVMPVTEQQPVSGRAVFAVNRVDVGVAVHTAFFAEDGRLLQMPAVFPNLDYALQQIDEMRQMVVSAFSQTQ